MGQLSTKVDVAVIGAGPGGYTAAIRAAQLGKSVILIEKNKLGGTCTNVGCIPSKALIHAASVKSDAQSIEARNMGIDASVKFDFKKTINWKNQIVHELSGGIGSLCKLNDVEVIFGTAFFTSSNSLSVETDEGLRSIDFEKAIIATGTIIKGLTNLPYDHQRIIDSDDVLGLSELPKHLIVVGAGYIAIEMAILFRKFGSQVTLIHRGESILKNFEQDMVDVLTKKLRDAGIEFLFKSDVESVNGNIAKIKTPQETKEIEFDKLLVATGRVPYYDGLNLERTKVTLDQKNLVIVDQTMRTSDENIYAIGDVVAGPQLAHKAFRQGKVAAEAICGLPSAFDNRCIPVVIFSDPELGSVGLTESEALAAGHKLLIGKMPYSASGRAKSLNLHDGFVKVLANEQGIILGVHVAGTGADGIIAEATLAIEMAATLEDVATTIHTHPTLSEILTEAAEVALGKAIHIYDKDKKKI